jgi:hypothetical protein
LVGKKTYLQKLQAGGALTADQWAELTQYFEESASAPVQQSIICKDAECVYYTSCPLVRASIPRPFGDPCVIEETVKRNWQELYFADLGKAEDGFAAVDRGLIIDLVNTMLDIKRAQDELVDQPAVAERVLKGFDKDNNAIVELRMNPVHFYLANARKLKAKLLDIQVATREARAKDKTRKTESAAQFMTELNELVNDMRDQQRKAMESSMQDAEFEVSGPKRSVGTESLSDPSKALGIMPVSDAPDPDDEG